MTDQRDINTEGGAYNEGRINTGGGTFVGRDQTGDSYNIEKVQAVVANIGGTVNIENLNIIAPPPAQPDLDSALHCLNALPLNTIPDPASLPPSSRMPLSQNPLFVGREAALLKLAWTLKEGQTSAIGQVAVATGLGGIGKTQLATEFVHRYGQFFAGGVFWLSFADANAVPNEIANCGRRGCLDLAPDFDQLKLEDQVRLVTGTWQSPLPRLLVFDNCDDEDLLAKWRPTTGGCRVLVTSRRQRWSKVLGVKGLALDTLSRAQSIELLRKYRTDLPVNDPTLAKIAEELGDLPLALHLAGTYLVFYRHVVTPAMYLAALGNKIVLDHPSLQGSKECSATAHNFSVCRTFALSYNRLQPDDPVDALALALLARAACFAPGEPIPRPLLVATLQLQEDDDEAPLRAEDGLQHLVELGLIDEEENGAVRLHRLVSIFTRGQQSRGWVKHSKSRLPVISEAQQAVEKTLLAQANQINETGYPALLLTWQAHLRMVTETALLRNDETSLDLCGSLGYFLMMIGDYTAARYYWERAVTICHTIYPEYHNKTVLMLNNLGLLLTDMGDYAAARRYLEQALAINEKILRPEHPDMSITLNSMGYLLNFMGDYAAAKPYYERALAIREKTLGPEHPDTTQSLNNLGLLLNHMGHYAAARPYLERAFAINEKVLGPEHPETALNLNNLGLLLSSMGDYANARLCLERALTIFEKVLSPEHPDTTLSLINLGVLLISIGDYIAAKPYLERALAIREKVFGPEHPDTAVSLNSLGFLLIAVGDYTVARPYIERALAIFENMLGPEHRDTARSLNNLAILLNSMGDYVAAKSYHGRALAIREKTLGPEHPDTARSLIWVGVLQAQDGDLIDACAHLRRALDILTRSLGAEHPDTRQCQDYLASYEQQLRESE